MPRTIHGGSTTRRARTEVISVQDVMQGVTLGVLSVDPPAAVDNQIAALMPAGAGSATVLV